MSVETTRTYTGTATFDSGKGNNLSITFLPVETKYTCQYCDDAITLDQVKKCISGTVKANQVKIINQLLPFMNKYRKDYGLDTCLKKAHFIAQVTHESAKFSALGEGEVWKYRKKNKATGKIVTLPGVFSNNKIVFDEVMGKSLFKHLDKIFVIKDECDVSLVKTNAEIKELLIYNKVQVVDKKLYTNYKQGEELLAEIEDVTELPDCTQVITKLKIYLKNHSHFGIPLLSRMYAPYPGDRRGLGNGDELSRDGWKYKGRGLKQLTGLGHYEGYTKYRNKNTFPGDTTGKIDFAKNDDTASPQDVKKGNYVKVAEPMYAVQSALFFWNFATKYSGKYAVEHAEKDDISGVSKAVNRYESANLSKREACYNLARKKDAFDILRHFKDIYDNGTKSQKKEAKAYFEKWKGSDAEAKKILDGLKEEK